MTTDPIPYSKNNASGIELLGDVPSHWAVRRLRNTCTMKVSNVDKHTRDGEFPVRLCNYVDVYKNDRIRSQLSFMSATATRDEIERFRLQSGDVLITKDSETWDDIGVPALIESTGDNLVCGYHLALLRPFPRPLNSTYLFRALQSVSIQYQFHIAARGVTRYGLSHNAIKSVWLPVPPHIEQVAIARFLKYVDDQIRCYIRAKQRLIILFKEYRKSIIHHAMTHGLDPNVRLKPSGIESLGDIPGHWEVRRLKDIGELVAGSGFPHNYQGNTDEKLPFYKVSDLVASSDGRLMKEAPNTVSREVATHLRARPIPQNSIVYAKIGAALLLNRRRITSRPCCIDNNMTAYIPNRQKSTTAWSYYWMSTIDFSQFVSPGAIPLIGEGDQGKIPFLVPTLAEQSEIVSFLDGKIADIDATIASVRHEVELLREYRTRLTADVVTGKLDVREIADRLPVDSGVSEKQDAFADAGEEWVDNTNTCSEGSETWH